MAKVNSNYQRFFALDLTVATNLGMPTDQKSALQCTGLSVTAEIDLANSTAAVRCSKALWGSCQQWSSSSVELLGTHSADMCRQVPLLLHHHPLCTHANYSGTRSGVCPSTNITSLVFAGLPFESHLLPPSNTECHRDRALPHSGNCINLLKCRGNGRARVLHRKRHTESRQCGFLIQYWDAIFQTGYRKKSIRTTMLLHWIGWTVIIILLTEFLNGTNFAEVTS